MKKIIVLFILTVGLLAEATAQQVKFGIEAGANFSHYKNSISHAKKKGGMGVGFQIGGTVDYEFRHHWMLMSGISFMQTQSNMKLADASVFYFPDTEIKLSHLTVPIKVGYNIHVCQNFNLIPFIGVYGSYDFNAGSCAVIAGANELVAQKQDKWKPMDGYSYNVPSEQTYEYEATIDAFRHWTYGGMGGLKAVIANHYTISFQYYEAIKKVQKQCKLRNYGCQISIGYQF